MVVLLYIKDTVIISIKEFVVLYSNDLKLSPYVRIPLPLRKHSKTIKISVKLLKISVGSVTFSGSAQGFKTLIDLIYTHKS